MTLRFDNRVALVTGAGNGLGKAYALWLAERGAKVVINNRLHADRPSSAQAVVDEIVAAGGEAIADHESVEAAGSGARMVDHALAAYGQLDVIIANAAVSLLAETGPLTLDDYRKAMEINCFGAIDPVLAALPHMRLRNYGRIIVTTSAAALFGAPKHTAYAASKMALVGFARALSVELKRTGIKINTVSPYARTNMSKHSIAAHLDDTMAPARVAPVVGWLASERCERSGAIFSIGGGRVRRTAIVETPAVGWSGEPPEPAQALDDLGSAIESRDARWSSTALVPELIERRD